MEVARSANSRWHSVLVEEIGMSQSESVAVSRLPFRRLIVEVFARRDHDFTTASLPHSMLVLGLPMALEMLAQSLFAVIAILWVARLGGEAVALVGIAEAAMSLVYALSTGMAYAATAIVARRIGEGDPGAASEVAGQVLSLGAIVSLCAGAILIVMTPQILGLLGADAALIDRGSGYARVLFGGNLSVFLMLLLSAIARGAGEAHSAMRALWIANLLNVAIAPLLIFGLGDLPALGVVGAAIATTVSRGIGATYQVVSLARPGGRLRLRWAHLIPRARYLKIIVGTARDGVLQALIGTTSAIGLYAIAAKSGTTALAGCTIALRVSQFVLMPALGVARAGATLVGQNLGARKPDRAAEAIRLAAWISLIVFGSCSLLLFVMASPVAMLFSTDEAVLREAETALRIVAIGVPCYAIAFSFAAAFNGAGDTRTPAWSNFACLWMVQVPVAWLLAQGMGQGAKGVYLSVPISFGLLALTNALLFYKGAWRRVAL